MSWTEIMTGLVKHDEDGGGFSMMLNGEGYANALVDAVAANYPRPDLHFPEDEKVTVLRYQRGAMGHSAIAALSGTIFQGTRGLAILPKGKRKNGYSLTAMLDNNEILDVRSGYNREQAFMAGVEGCRRDFPKLRPLTQERLNQLSSRSNQVTLAVFGTYPFYGHQAAATVWLCHSYIKDDDILENVLIIDPAVGESEHGSCYGKDLLRMNVGEVVGFNPLTFKDALDLTDKHPQATWALLRSTEMKEAS